MSLITEVRGLLVDLVFLATNMGPENVRSINEQITANNNVLQQPKLSLTDFGLQP